MGLGGAQYSCLCAEDGGILDDLFAYRLAGDRYLLVTNSANHEGDLALARSLEPATVTSPSATSPIDTRCSPCRARTRVARSLRHWASSCRARMRVATARIGERPALVCGTGYTGEDGVELLIDPEIAPAIWAELLDAGAVPCGLAARDTLRLEACFHLHGNDMGPDRNPIEAGLGWCCKEETDFIGSEAVARARAEGPAERSSHSGSRAQGIPRARMTVLSEGEAIGVVTSGTFSPSLELGIGMAYLRSELAEPGTEIEIDVRGKRRAARVASKPLYSSSRKEN